jgi:hypothetical protein
LVGCLDDADPFTVIAADGQLSDAGEPANLGKCVVNCGRGGNRPSGLGKASIRKSLAHDSLVVGEG